MHPIAFADKGRCPPLLDIPRAAGPRPPSTRRHGREGARKRTFAEGVDCANCGPWRTPRSRRRRDRLDKLASVVEEQITEKIGRRVISGKQGTMVYWSMKAGAHVAAQHPQEQFAWVIKGAIRLRIGTEEQAIKPGDVAVITGGVEHEAFFPEDTEVIDFFAPVREDFLTGEVPPYMAQR
jgi:quercetin dioxygenase-like cupin family protein